MLSGEKRQKKENLIYTVGLQLDFKSGCLTERLAGNVPTANYNSIML